MNGYQTNEQTDPFIIGRFHHRNTLAYCIYIHTWIGIPIYVYIYTYKPCADSIPVCIFASMDVQTSDMKGLALRLFSCETIVPLQFTKNFNEYSLPTL